MLDDEFLEFSNNYRLMKDSRENALLLKKYRMDVYDVFNNNFTS